MPQATSNAGSIPAVAGIGLRAQHQDEILRRLPRITWLEAHSENYFGAGGGRIDTLLRLREHYPLSLHGVGLSLGSADPLNREHLSKLARLIERTQPTLVSEHLSWGSIDGVFANDLLPLPYTEESLTHMIARVGEAQDFLGRRILIENVSSYLRYAHSTIDESEFLNALAGATGCGLLVDVNNFYVSQRNHGLDARRAIASILPKHAGELHLAGHTVKRNDGVEIVIDTHSAPVCDAVWDLYAFAVAHFGPVPTLIEWDADLPALDVLMAEAAKASLQVRGRHDRAA